LLGFIGKCIDVIEFLTLINDNFVSVISSLLSNELELLSGSLFKEFVNATKESELSKLVFKLIDKLVKN
jgi:hypothetical protein